MTTTSPDSPDQLLKFINTEVSLVDELIVGDTDLMMTGAVDSLGVMRITQWFEDEAGIEVDPTEVVLENFRSVDAMMAFWRTKT